jgi:iron complex outermembrane recepter protein
LVAVISILDWSADMRRLYAFLLILLLYASALLAAEVRGTVVNYANGFPLNGASVRFPAFNVETTTDADGRFRFTDLSAGRYILTISAKGFHTVMQEQLIADSAQIYNLTVELKPNQPGENSAEYQANEPRYNMREVTVLTTRASSRQPVTYTNLNEQEIHERTYGQDLPVLLTEMPNVTAYSDGASGMGYSYLRMRGFGQNRVAVEINGTPLNDAGDAQVYWINLPDFAEDLQDIQVQRGVGSALYGSAAFGGTINVVTRTPGLTNRPNFHAEGTLGAWGTRRAMVSFESGRIQKQYGIAGRLTRMSTNGYRDNSWAKLWSYYLSAARFSKAHTTRVVFYGGPEQTHLAYNGIPKSLLSTERRFNDLTYKGEIDNFFQPHYEIHDDWKISDKLSAFNSVYLFRGDGYYDQYRSGVNATKYFFNSTITDSTINILRRLSVNETDWGWIPRLTYNHHIGETTLGGELRFHDANHSGQVVWSSATPADIGPDYHYYDYRIHKESYSGYIHNIFNLAKNLKAMADLQLQLNSYRMDRDRLWGVSWSEQYLFGTPHVGLNWRFLTPDGKTGTPAAEVYVNYSEANREPATSDIYDPSDFDKLPLNDPVQFFRLPGGFRYIGHGLNPEEMQNIEIGNNWQWVHGRFGMNFYWMSLRNEIVPYGPLDSLGVPLVTNAERTLHQGLEFVGAWGPADWLTLSGNLAFTDHHFVHYRELDWNTGTLASRDGNRLANDPPYVVNLRAEFRYANPRIVRDMEFFLVPNLQAVGKQFIDNTETDSSAVPANVLLNLDCGFIYTHVGSVAKAVELRFRVNNVLDRKFETFGFWGDVEPVYIVGAPRAVYSTLAVDF